MICLFIYEIYDTFTHSWLVAYTHNTLGIVQVCNATTSVTLLLGKPLSEKYPVYLYIAQIALSQTGTLGHFLGPILGGL